MSFENSTVPLSLFNEDGSMRLPSCKSDFMTKLEKVIQQPCLPLESQQADSFIVDGQFAIQLLPFYQGITYREMAAKFFQYVLNSSDKVGHNVKQIHIVFDRYFDYSIKSQARLERSKEDITSSEYHISLDAVVSVSKESFLQKSYNKTSLAKLYAGYIQESFDSIPEGLSIFISGGCGDVCLKVSNEGNEEISSLVSNQEEADTRMILDCAEAAKS